MPAVTLANLMLYAAQAALVIGALAALFAALRPSPALRLAACRAVLLALLVLPWQALLRPPAPELPPVSLVGATPGFVDAIDARVPDGMPWGAIVGGVVAAGVVLRLLWLTVGLVRLSQWRAIRQGWERHRPLCSLGFASRRRPGEHVRTSSMAEWGPRGESSVRTWALGTR